MPASVSPESFQAQQGFIAALAPVLARPLEAALGLPTKLTRLLRCQLIKPRAVQSLLHLLFVSRQVLQVNIGSHIDEDANPQR